MCRASIYDVSVIDGRARCYYIYMYTYIVDVHDMYIVHVQKCISLHDHNSFLYGKFYKKLGGGMGNCIMLYVLNDVTMPCRRIQQRLYCTCGVQRVRQQLHCCFIKF